jgi:hypothetical protein
MNDTSHHLDSMPEDAADVGELREQNRKMRKALRRGVIVLFRTNQPHMTRDILATLKEMNEALR